MILADASIWIAHFRSGNAELQTLLGRREILMHPFVLGELELGNIPDRRQTLEDLNLLFEAPCASHLEAMRLLRAHGLAGRGIGYVDLRLLTSACVGPDVRLWTRDRRLGQIAEMLKVGFSPLGAA